MNAECSMTRVFSNTQIIHHNKNKIIVKNGLLLFKTMVLWHFDLPWRKYATLEQTELWEKCDTIQKTIELRDVRFPKTMKLSLLILKIGKYPKRNEVFEKKIQTYRTFSIMVKLWYYGKKTYNTKVNCNKFK